MNAVFDLIYPNHWDAATRLNVAASIGICINTLIYIILGFINRRRFVATMDIARWATTLYLLAILMFFANRAYDVAEAGRTVATWRLQTASVLLLIVSFVAPIIAIRDPFRNVPPRSSASNPAERNYDKDPVARKKINEIIHEMRIRQGGI